MLASFYVSYNFDKKIIHQLWLKLELEYFLNSIHPFPTNFPFQYPLKKSKIEALWSFLVVHKWNICVIFNGVINILTSAIGFAAADINERSVSYSLVADKKDKFISKNPKTFTCLLLSLTRKISVILFVDKSTNLAVLYCQFQILYSLI